MGEPIFRLFACCIPVKGARRSVVCDLQRNKLSFIPNGLFEILTEHADCTLSEIKTVYGNEYNQEIDEYFDFLVGEDLGFWCDDPTEFPPLDLTWNSPDLITNAIIDVGAGSRHDFPKILRELDDLGCKALQLRFYCPTSLEKLREILMAAKYGRLRSIEILMPYAEEISSSKVEALCVEFQRISRVILSASPEDRFERLEKLGVPVLFRKDALTSPQCCGEVHPGYFAINLGMFSEAQSFNTCLNRKISIDESGFIRNCPSLDQAFGNVRDVSLQSALLQNGSQDLWTIGKDQVEVCRDCEFRYICTDCRAYVSVPGDRYAKPAKCRYDPYTATWR